MLKYKIFEVCRKKMFQITVYSFGAFHVLKKYLEFLMLEKMQ